MRKDPRAYTELIVPLLAVPDNSQLGRELNGPQMRFGRALGLAAELGREHGGPLVHMAFGAIDDRMGSVQRQMAAGVAATAPAAPVAAEVLRTLDNFRCAILEIAERLKDPFAIPYVLNRLGELNHGGDQGTIFVMLHYLATVAPGDSLAYERIKALVDAPGSRLAQNPQARRTLEALHSGSQPATRPSAVPTQPAA